jgi:hypothetical protein
MNHYVKCENFTHNNNILALFGKQVPAIKEGPLTKNVPIDFAQCWVIHMKKSNYIYGEEKKRGSFAFLGP